MGDMGGLLCVGGRWVPDWLSWLDHGPPPHTWTQKFSTWVKSLSWERGKRSHCLACHAIVFHWLSWLDHGPPPHTWTQLFNFSSVEANVYLWYIGLAELTGRRPSPTHLDSTFHQLGQIFILGKSGCCLAILSNIIPFQQSSVSPPSACCI